jgi:hypothetical protein
MLFTSERRALTVLIGEELRKAVDAAAAEGARPAFNGGS